MTRQTSSAIQARKLALSAGKTHRARMQELLKQRQEIQQEVLPEIKNHLKLIRKKENIDKRDSEPLERIIDLVTRQATVSESASAEVLRIYKDLCRSKTAHPLILAIAGIVADGVTAATKPPTTSAGPPTSSVMRKWVGSPLWWDIKGAEVGWDEARKNGYDVAGAVGHAIEKAATWSYNALQSHPEE
jgi:hypothetical protein